MCAPDGSIAIEIVDPHGHQFGDALPKLRGLARYAEKNPSVYRRFEVVAQVGNQFRIIDLTEASTRAAVLEPEQISRIAIRRHAASRASLKTIVRIAIREAQPLVRWVRRRTFKKVDSVGLIVRLSVNPVNVDTRAQARESYPTSVGRFRRTSLTKRGVDRGQLLIVS